jgi:hypothetical protein
MKWNVLSCLSIFLHTFKPEPQLRLLSLLLWMQFHRSLFFFLFLFFLFSFFKPFPSLGDSEDDNLLSALLIHRRKQSAMIIIIAPECYLVLTNFTPRSVRA